MDSFGVSIIELMYIIIIQTFACMHQCLIITFITLHTYRDGAAVIKLNRNLKVVEDHLILHNIYTVSA